MTSRSFTTTMGSADFEADMDTAAAIIKAPIADRTST
jgi:hypothetical protein